MPYNTRTLMQHMARGRPMPKGSPEQDLLRAMERLSPLDMEHAISQGARPDACDSRGRSAFHVLFDAAFTPKSTLQVPMERLIACCRAALRNGTDPSRPHPVTGQTALYRTAVLAHHPMAATWWLFTKNLHRGNLLQSGGRNCPSTLEAWHANSSDEGRKYLPALWAYSEKEASDVPVSSVQPLTRRVPRP